MRQNAPWMKQQDDRILEYLRAEDWGSPSTIASETSIDISRGHIRERLHRLQYAGLVVPMWDDTYELTRDGLLYLRGHINAAYLPEPTRGRLK